MPLYSFKTVREKGVLEADSLAAAKEKLRAQQMMVIEVKPHETIRKSLHPKQVLIITRLLAQLLKAGIPIYEAAVIVEEKFSKAPFHPLLVDICDRLKKGSPLSTALELYPTAFDSIYRAIIRAGEVAGELQASCEALTSLLESKERLKKQLLTATSYPLFLGLFCFAVFISLLTWVIPPLKNLFEGRALHPLTAGIFHLSDFLLAHQIPFFLLGAATVAGFIGALYHPKLRPLWDLLILKLPGLGHLALLSATERFCSTLALLIQGGEPLPSALETARPSLKNRILILATIAAEKEVAAGAPLSHHVAWMPPYASRMLSVAEKTGKLGPMFAQIAHLSEEELRHTLERYSSLLQPILLLLLGLLIGTVVLSILIPLTDVGSMF